MDQETNDLIKNEIENNEVCLFMKGTPDAHNVVSQWRRLIF